MSKTIIISNRLPLKIALEDDKLRVTPSVGGLATEEEIPDHLEEEVKEKAKAEDCIAVNLTEEEVDGFYYGFSNRTIWPLFHYFMEFTEAEHSSWEIYKQVNIKYAKEVLKHYEAGDRVWVHDYQLLLVPKLIRDEEPEAIIGFFNHIPFPSYEVFRTLPWRESVLEGMLGADLIGFHTYDYERHFLSSVQRSDTTRKNCKG